MEETADSPCIFVCTLVDNGVEDMCVGCGRTDTEIAKWQTYTEDEKKAINKLALNRLREE